MISINSELIEKWDMFELSLKGTSKGNPFVEVQFSAEFKNQNIIIEVKGFYDGNGLYRLRFMPDELGKWDFVTKSNVAELNNHKGSFNCKEASRDNHGSVKVRNTYHFSYSDGKPFFPFGTTCYAWTNQEKFIEEKTLETLKHSPFNKVRMCLLPKSESYKSGKPKYFPYEVDENGSWIFDKFNPDFFKEFEECVKELQNLGIEADVILFHPYDNDWGFNSMDKPFDDLYIKYVITRLSAFRNVWWSIANEFDYIHSKTEEDWDRLFQIVQAEDKYSHLRSIHNGTEIYNNNKEWVTHASIQNGSAVADFGRAILLRDVYKKPIVFDEVCYEGNSERRWGQLSGEELVERFCHGIIDGTYVGHGEILDDENGDSWLAKGIKYRGKSVERIAFLRKLIEETLPQGLEPSDKWQNTHLAGKNGEYYIYYFGKEKPGEWYFGIPAFKKGLQEGLKFKVDIIDTWNMTIKPIDKIFTTKLSDKYNFVDIDNGKVSLPELPYLALRIIKL